MKLLLLVAIVVALLLFLVVDLAERAVEPSPAVKTSQQWGRERPPYVVDGAATSTVPPRARTAPSKRTTMRAASVSASSAESVAVIRDVFARFGPAVVEEAIRVSGCETGGTYNPAIVNGGGHTGLFQLSPKYHTERAARLGFTWAQMQEARPNALVAADIFAESHWGPWTCRYAA